VRGMVFERGERERERGGDKVGELGPIKQL
jgi:hypothetical protein